MRSTWSWARNMRARASGASDTARPPRATDSTSAIVNERPSRTTVSIMAGMSDGSVAEASEVVRRLLKSTRRSAVASPVVVELQIRLRTQRDEEVEGEVAVRRLREGEDGIPVVHLAAERHGVHAELLADEVVIRRPLHRPFRRYAEARGTLNVPRGGAHVLRAAAGGRCERVGHARRCRVLLHALFVRERIHELEVPARLRWIDEDRVRIRP